MNKDKQAWPTAWRCSFSSLYINAIELLPLLLPHNQTFISYFYKTYFMFQKAFYDDNIYL